MKQTPPRAPSENATSTPSISNEPTEIFDFPDVELSSKDLSCPSLLTPDALNKLNWTELLAAEGNSGGSNLQKNFAKNGGLECTWTDEDTGNQFSFLVAAHSGQEDESKIVKFLESQPDFEKNSGNEGVYRVGGYDHIVDSKFWLMFKANQPIDQTKLLVALELIRTSLG